MFLLQFSAHYIFLQCQYERNWNSLSRFPKGAGRYSGFLFYETWLAWEARLRSFWHRKTKPRPFIRKLIFWRKMLIYSSTLVPFLWKFPTKRLSLTLLNVKSGSKEKCLLFFLFFCLFVLCVPLSNPVLKPKRIWERLKRSQWNSKLWFKSKHRSSSNSNSRRNRNLVVWMYNSGLMVVLSFVK